MSFCIFFFNTTATPDVYTLSLHDALPIYFFAGFTFSDEVEAGEAFPAASLFVPRWQVSRAGAVTTAVANLAIGKRDRKSTRLNSSHTVISYAVFCLKKKKKKKREKEHDHK